MSVAPHLVIDAFGKLRQALTTGADMLRVGDRLTIAEWAERYRVLPAGSPRPGPWSNATAPWLLDPWSAVEDPRTRWVFLEIASQMSKTEFLFLCIGHRMHQGPLMPCLYVAPTQKLAGSISKGRLGPMFRKTRPLADRMAGGHSDATFEKYIGGMRLGFAWANSAVELASHPSGLVVLDEYGSMPDDVEGQGAPELLAGARTKNYRAGTTVVVGSPTRTGDGTLDGLCHTATLERFSWRCRAPRCSELFVPARALFDYHAGRPGVACPHCGTLHHDEHKLERNQPQNGACYVPHKLDGDENLIVDPEPAAGKPRRSFKVSGLCSTFTSYDAIASDTKAAAGNDRAEMALVNTIYGEPYDPPGERPEWEHVLTLAGGYRMGEVPGGVQVVTAGVDVQKRSLWYVIRGYGYAFESWLLAYGQLDGDTVYDDVWQRLFRVLTGDWGGHRVAAAFVDSGYKPGEDSREDHKVYTVCKRWRGVYPTKGQDTASMPVRSVELKREGVTLFHIDSDFFKSHVYQRIGWDRSEPGGFHLPAEMANDQGYARQVTSEQRQVSDRGVRWVRKHPHNHLLDCEALSAAAAHFQRVQDLKPIAAPLVEAVSENAKPAAAPPPASARRGALMEGFRGR